MSAAEKLKALDEAAHDEWAGECIDCYTPAPNQAKVLIAALPQIVAVVEAAEHSLGWAQDELLHGPPELGLIVGELTPALAALDDALSPPTGGSP